MEMSTEGGPRISTTPRIEVVPARPPRWISDVSILRRITRGESRTRPLVCCRVEKRGNWPGLRPLTGVVSFPMQRPDGSFLSTPGYDAATGLYLHWQRPPLSIPERPTLDDAIKAVAALFDAVGDFPFASGMHKAAWLAALLTPLTRAAFDGPAPLFLVDANVRAAGKGLSLEVISRIVTGNPFPVISYPVNPKDCEEELRKKITTFLLYGERLALFDNLTGAFGDATLDRALTSNEWQDRRLGSNTQFRGPMSVTFYGTGNNVIIKADTARRIRHIRLESP